MTALAEGSRRPGWPAALLAVTLLAAPLLLAAAAVQTRDYPLAAFDRLQFSGAGKLHLTQGDSTRLTARGSTATLDALQVDVRDGTLHIDTRHAGSDLEVDLQVADLRAIVSRGAAHITSSGLHADNLLLHGSGAGSFDLRGLEAQHLEVRGQGATRFALTGQVGSHVINLRGSGAYQAGELISDHVRIDVAGASDVRLWADELLDVVVAGSARIRYAGSPRVEQQVSGLARVLRVPQIII
ncbi:MAG: head GIN domain-containing protein [Gammaproteobacteria bacterium]|nr:head GIN domain-containing protein [Gammaproteobacteria bacterium]